MGAETGTNPQILAEKDYNRRERTAPIREVSIFFVRPSAKPNMRHTHVVNPIDVGTIIIKNMVLP